MVPIYLIVEQASISHMPGYRTLCPNLAREFLLRRAHSRKVQKERTLEIALMRRPVPAEILRWKGKTKGD